MMRTLNSQQNPSRACLRTLLQTSIACIAITFGSAVFAGGDIEAGREEAKACSGCHAEDGNSTMPANPILAGQYESYLIQALKSYRSGARKNPIMNPMAGPMTDKQIADLAAFFASQKSALRTAGTK